MESKINATHSTSLSPTASPTLKRAKKKQETTYSDEEAQRVLELLQAAQFDLGKKTNAVKIIRKERS